MEKAEGTMGFEIGFNEMLKHIGNNFTNEAGFRSAKKYMQGLLSTAERKNGWQMAEAVGESTPYALQQFIYRGRYSADGLRDDLREYVNDILRHR